MKSKDAKPGSNPEKTSRAGPMVLMLFVLCGFSFHLGGIFSSEKNGFLSSDSISAAVNHKDTALSPLKNVPVTFLDCGIEYQDYTPCIDPKRWWRYGYYRLNFMERHCPPMSERKECLVLPPSGYRVPIRWPQSKNEC